MHGRLMATVIVQESESVKAADDCHCHEAAAHAEALAAQALVAQALADD